MLAVKVAIVPCSRQPLDVPKECVSDGWSLLFIRALRAGAKLRL